MKYPNIREEELKNKVAQDYFWLYDCTKIMGNVDFCVLMHQSPTVPENERESLLWAEAKRGASDIYKSLVQLILTIGKARTFDRFLPPAFLGAFDGEKIAFLPYGDVQEVFYINDFNWNVTPSDHDTREFRLVHDRVKKRIDDKALLFRFGGDDRELRSFIKENFVVGKFGQTKTKIDKNNFMVIYNKWLQAVKPSIAVRWDMAQKNGLIDGDFYLADLLSHENSTLKEKLFVLLRRDHYVLDRKINEFGLFIESKTSFTDGQKAHTQFWNKYERPPKSDYWDYMVERRDLLVPQDVRERKGSFFTPQIWVELSQRYLTEVLGEDWQDEYYVWDCAAGTGNLLNGLTNKYRIWASTLDQQDVEVMRDRISNGANLLPDHVFRFDFLNDDFAKLPQALQNIINDPQKRKKLVVYINPPYAEASDKKTLGKKEGKSGVEQSRINKKYAELLGQANAELFAQFFIRVNKEIPGCVLAEFSTLKILQGQHFIDFRKNFHAKLEKMFLMPADTFDNVKGQFPIGFFIWDGSKKENFTSIDADVYDHKGCLLGKKLIQTLNDNHYINDWIKPFRANKNDPNAIGKFPFKGNDFQNQNMIAIVQPNTVYNKEAGQFLINPNNLIKASIYFAVRHCIKATWLNDRDQFLYPNQGWEKDEEFRNDCLAYTLFHGQNRISAKEGPNHWIPFTEPEVDARTAFESNFMTDFIKGKPKPPQNRGYGGILSVLFEPEAPYHQGGPLKFSEEAQALFDAGRALWKYYHRQPDSNVNAALYDIREHFQGRNEAGKMNAGSADTVYTELIEALRERLNLLGQKLEPKVYEYGFLKG